MLCKNNFNVHAPVPTCTYLRVHACIYQYIYYLGHMSHPKGGKEHPDTMYIRGSCTFRIRTYAGMFVSVVMITMLCVCSIGRHGKSFHRSC